eukprot:5213971-Prymnesium_polylepis.1
MLAAGAPAAHAAGRAVDGRRPRQPALRPSRHAGLARAAGDATFLTPRRPPATPQTHARPPSATVRH